MTLGYELLLPSNILERNRLAVISFYRDHDVICPLREQLGRFRPEERTIEPVGR